MVGDESELPTKAHGRNQGWYYVVVKIATGDDKTVRSGAIERELYREHSPLEKKGSCDTEVEM